MHTYTFYIHVQYSYVGITGLAVYVPDIFSETKSALGKDSDDLVDGVLISVAEDKRILVWHIETGEFLFEISDKVQGHKDYITSILCVKQAKGDPLIVTASEDKTAAVWSLRTKKLVRKLDGGHTNAIRALALYTDESDPHASPLLVTASNDFTAVLW